MAPLPENSTARVWVDYHDGINPHALQVRHNGGNGNHPNVMASVDAFFTALAPQMYAITITGARYSTIGSNISLPLAWDGAPGYGSGAMPGLRAPFQICFLGRSNTGRQVRWFVFGCKLEAPNTYRFPLIADTELADAWNTIIAGQADGVWLAIDGNDPAMYNYVDANFNSYFEEKQRG